MSRRWFAALVLVAACATVRSRADDAYARADYLQAAELYDALVDDTPGNADLIARRDDARQRALAALLADVDHARGVRYLDEAVRSLRILFETRERWIMTADPAFDAAVAVDVRWVGDQVTAEARGFLGAHRPLAAETVVASRHVQLRLAALDDLWPALAGEIRAIGEAECRADRPPDAVASPYLTRLVAAYCGHFSIAVPAPVLPDLVSGLEPSIDVDGMTAAQRNTLIAAIARRFAASPWIGPVAPAIPVTLAGRQSARFTESQVVLEAPWVEQVPYLATESYQESYEEPYTDWESYTTQEPYTVYGSESYTCGSYDHPSTCTRSTSHTEYHSESHSRMVTRYRTAYRTAFRTVTRYRDEDRVHEYAALRRDGAYAGRWTLTIPLGAASAPLIVELDEDTRQGGYDHDDTFPEAGIAPSRAHLMTADDWFVHLLGVLEPALDAKLVATWQGAFCRSDAFTPETAARCAYGATLPPAAHTALFEHFGLETDLVIDRFAPHPR